MSSLRYRRGCCYSVVGSDICYGNNINIDYANGDDVNRHSISDDHVS